MQGLNPVFETRRLPTALTPTTSTDTSPAAALLVSPMREASAQNIRSIPTVSVIPLRLTMLAAANPNRVTVMLNYQDIYGGELWVGGKDGDAPAVNKGLRLVSGDTLNLDTTGEVWGLYSGGLGGQVSGLESVSTAKQQ